MEKKIKIIIQEKKMVFSYSVQQKANHFLIRLWYVMKSGFGTTADDDQLSAWTKKKIQNTA